MAGTRTVTDGFLTARDIASRVGASQVVAARSSENAPLPSGRRFPEALRHGILGGVGFVIITLMGVRSRLANSISSSMKHSNITNSLTAGLVVYPLIKLASGRCRELSWGGVSLGFLCLIYYIFGLPH